MLEVEVLILGVLDREVSFVVGGGGTSGMLDVAEVEVLLVAGSVWTAVVLEAVALFVAGGGGAECGGGAAGGLEGGALLLVGCQVVSGGLEGVGGCYWLRVVEGCLEGWKGKHYLL